MTIAPAFRGVAQTAGVAYNFVVAERDQRFLLPPDMRDWLPEDHLAWFVIDVVDQFDLCRFRESYRADGHGRAAYDPAMMVALLLYAYCIGVRSSRVIERRCVEDVAFRVLAGNHRPDHVTIARFRRRHEVALAEVFVDSLRLCADAGLVSLGTVFLDGTKIEANASKDASRTLDDIDGEVARILADAEAVDAADEERDRRDRDGGLPPALRDPRSRLARLREAKARLEADAAERRARFEDRSRQLNEARAAKGLAPRTFRPRPRDEAARPDARANVTDPDSRLLRRPGGTCQGYNAQVVCTAEQVIVAAELTRAVNDVEQLAPMLDALAVTTKAAGIRRRRPRSLVADAGYWRAGNVDGSIASAPELFIPVAKHGRRGKPRKDGASSESKTDHLVATMNTRMATTRGKKMARLRRITVEPTFGQIKESQSARRFMRRGFDACASEWELLCGVHNVLKLWRHQQAAAV